MPMLNIREMGSMGVVTDVAPWDLPASGFSDGMNFRLVSGKAQTTGGLERVSVSAGQVLGHIAQSTDLQGNSSWIVCGEDGILIFDGNNFRSLSGGIAKEIEESLSVDPSSWSSAKIGNVTFLNHPSLYPFYWRDSDQFAPGPLEHLPWHIGTEEETATWEDMGISCNAIRSHKNFLFALGITNPDGQFNDMLYWSHPAEPNGIPFSWRPTIQQPDSIAGSVSMGRGGAIVSGESLRDSFVIYSEEALNIMDFTGDSLGWRRRAISETAGLVNKNAIVEVKGQHIFFTGEDVLSFDGNSMQSLMHNRLRSRLSANVNNERVNNSWTAHYQAHNEVWIGVPEDGSYYPNRAYCYNYRDGTWSIRDLEKQIIHARSGREPKPSYLTWEIANTRWLDEKGSWTQAGDRPFREVMYGLSEDKVNDLDPDVSTAGGGSGDYSEQTWDQVTGAFPDGTRPTATNGDGWDLTPQEWDSESRSWIEVMLEETPTDQLDFIWAGAEGSWDEQESSWLSASFDGTWHSYYDYSWDEVKEAWHSACPPGSWDSYYDYSWDDMDALSRILKSDTWLLRTDLAIGGHEQNTTITRVYPLVEGTSSLEFRFGSQQFAGGPVTWAGKPRVFTPGKDRKIDIRTTGELHAFEVRSKDGFFKLTGMDIEYAMAGSR